MTERDCTVALAKALKAAMPDGEWTKHADRFTAGIPDGTWCWNGFTSWIETKLLKRAGSTILDELRPGQLPKAIKLERATGRCWFVGYDLRVRQTPSLTVYRPSDLVGWDGRHVVQWSSFAHKDLALWIRASHGGM